MVFNRKVLEQMLKLIEFNLSQSMEDSREPWPVKILQMASSFERISEYTLYGTYASQNILRPHPYQTYGARGLRLYGQDEALAKGRDSNEFLLDRLNVEGQPLTGYSYQKVAAEVAHLGLTHLQMEHM